MKPEMAMKFEKILSLLSSLYVCKPTKETIQNWKVLFNGEVPDFMKDLKGATDAIDPHSEQQMEDLLWEYTRLFIGPYKLPCPPWESVYASPKKLMMQEAYDEVKDLYNEIGLAITNPDVMADHIGAELNFLSILFDRIDFDPGKRLHYIDAAKRLLDKHLKTWIPQFTRDMEEAAIHPFYKALARITRNFVLTECNRLDQELV